MKKTGFTGYVYDFSVGYDDIEVDKIKDIHKYLMKRNNIVYFIFRRLDILCLDLLKSVFLLDRYFYQT